MLQSRFDELRERLLRAGIAPRHVRRYLGELRDHFEDLVREETANGVSRSAAEAKARARLGNNDDLAEVMLARPDLRSVMARYPWAVFGVAPVLLIFAVIATALLTEVGVIEMVSPFVPHPTVVERQWFVFAIAVWNTAATYVAPLAIAAFLCIAGLRQRMSPTWIFAGIVSACVVGAFQDIHFADDGHHGELSFGVGFLPPFPAKLIVGGLYRAVVTIALAGALYWYGARRQNGQADVYAAASLAAE
jgi:hypothetical protein